MPQDRRADKPQPSEPGAQAESAATATTAATATATTADPAPQEGGGSRLERWFQMRARGSNPRTEIVAGLSMFVATAYAAVVVPGQLAKAGMPHGPVTTAVILSIALATLGMGLFANLPFVLAPGLGGVALVAVTLVGQDHVPWDAALGMVLWSGVAFLLLTVFGIRDLITRLMPINLKYAISAGLGLYIALLGFRDSGLVVAKPDSDSLTLGALSSAPALLALGGLVLLTALSSRKVPGAFLITIAAVTLAGIPAGVTEVPDHLFGAPDSPGAVAFHVDILGALKPEYFPYIFAFFVSEFFSMTGTLLAVSGRAGLLDAQGNLPRMRRPFYVDSAAVIGGAGLGAPSMTAYLESSAGADSGGRTGLSSAVAACGFAALLLITPFATLIPSAATAPVLMYIGLNMLGALRKVDFTEPTNALPAAMLVATTVFFGNFGTGIAVGLTAHVLVKAAAGRFRELPWGLWIVMIPLGYYFYTLV
ncbi:NCS2 family permease [Streptomyces iconiensis]|uniref:NCS2 family permease n=1 Tax=Streptomyces iconiensis TaxID=1384038 RepID=A0ABT6ZQN5_9ACTN|nr:NCS2 family permease [Streptomyces iconiensis]MDJ1131172.1 NCS2 family permease [Streptomyces iconiensis]